MTLRKESQRTKVRYSGSVDVVDSATNAINKCTESSLNIYPLSLKASNEITAKMNSNESKLKLVAGNSLNNSVKKHRSKTVRKYKISFSYACTADQETCQVSPKIINLQRLDQVTTKSDHQFVSDKLKPVMTCIVQRLIQEYRRSNQPSAINNVEAKSSTHDTYTLSSSKLENHDNPKMKGDLQCRTKQDGIAQERFLHPMCDQSLEQMEGKVQSHTTSRFQKSSSPTKCSSPAHTKQSLSNEVDSTGVKHVLSCLVKDTYLFKRTKFANYLNTDITDIVRKAKILKSYMTLSHSRDNVTIDKGTEAYSCLYKCYSHDKWEDRFVSHLISYRRNIHLSEFSIVKGPNFNQIREHPHKLICIQACMDSYQNYKQQTSKDCNYSNEKDEEGAEKMNEETKIVSDPVEGSVGVKKIHMAYLDPAMKSCKMIKNMSLHSAATKAHKTEDEDESLSSEFSVISTCKICMGDPVICLESEGRKSLIQHYVELLEESEGIVVRKKSDDNVDMENLKDLLYRFMEDNNAYPSERVKTDILKRRNKTEDNVNKELGENSKMEKWGGLQDVANVNGPEDVNNDGGSRTKKIVDVGNELDDAILNMDVIEELISDSLENVDEIEPLKKYGSTGNTGESKVLTIPTEFVADSSTDSVSILKPLLKTSHVGEISENLINEFDNANTKTHVVDFYLPEQVIVDTTFLDGNNIPADKTDINPLSTTQVVHEKDADTELSFGRNIFSTNNPSTKSRSSKVVSKDNRGSSSRNSAFDDLIKHGDQFNQFIQDTISQKRKNENDLESDDDEEFTASIKVLAQPLNRRSTIYRNSVHYPENHPLTNVLSNFERTNEAIEIDQFPSDDIFVEIEDFHQKKQRRFSVVDVNKPQNTKDKAAGEVYDSNNSPPLVSSSSSLIKISTYGDLIKEEIQSSESSYESSGSQDTSEDLTSKYPNEITNFIDIFNNLSFEDEGNLMNSLKRNLQKHKNQGKDDVKEAISENAIKLASTLKNVSSSSLPYGEEKDKNIPDEVLSAKGKKPQIRSSSISKGSTSKKDGKANDAQELDDEKKRQIQQSKMKGIDANIIDNKQQISYEAMYNEVATQTDLDNLVNMLKDAQGNFDYDLQNQRKVEKEKYLNEQDANMINRGSATINEGFNKTNRDSEIESILGKLRRILSKSEEYLQSFSNISQGLPNKNYGTNDSVNIPKDIFVLLRDLCRQDEVGYESNEEKYKTLDRNLESICKSLNALETPTTRISSPKKSQHIDDEDNVHLHSSGNIRENDDLNHENVYKNVYDGRKGERGHVDFKESEHLESDSLFEKVVRCVMYKLMENQNRNFATQEQTPFETRSRDVNHSEKVPQGIKYKGHGNVTRSLDNVSLLDRPMFNHHDNRSIDEVYTDETDYHGDSMRRELVQSKSRSPNVDSLIAECLPKESIDLIKRVRSHNEKLDCLNVYDEIASRMNSLLQQVKRSQRQCRTSAPSTRSKTPFPSKSAGDKKALIGGTPSDIPRSYSASDIRQKSLNVKRNVARHTVASIQNIISNTNQSRKIKSGFRNVRKELRDKATRMALNTKTRQKMLCSSAKEENVCNSTIKDTVAVKTISKRKIVR